MTIPEFNAFGKTHGERGHWARTSIPHGPGCGTDRICTPSTPWDWLAVEDLGDPKELCRMCEHEVIRYVFTMQHVGWPENLFCGRCCAGWMMGEPEEARLIERWAKNGFKRHKTHLRKVERERHSYRLERELEYGRKQREVQDNRSRRWVRNDSGNWYVLERRVVYALVYRKHGGWMFSVDVIHKPPKYWDKRIFETLEEAQHEALVWAYPDPIKPDVSDATLNELFKTDPSPVFTREMWERQREREKALDPGWLEPTPHG